MYPIVSCGGRNYLQNFEGNYLVVGRTPSVRGLGLRRAFRREEKVSGPLKARAPSEVWGGWWDSTSQNRDSSACSGQALKRPADIIDFFVGQLGGRCSR